MVRGFYFTVENDIYVISDEIYENLCYGKEEAVSIASLNNEIYKRTITVNGLAKSYAMTGWRIGYAGAPLEIAKIMGNVQSHQTSNPNSIAQKAAIEAISGNQTCVREMNAAFDERRKYIFEKLKNARFIKDPTVDEIIDSHRWAKEYVESKWANS